ncbi:MAG TPA: hypothetical protein VLV83_10830 [Acidobacteriota bacterium]|nr:hypothetical protein [Acidobacteriota bacterium]
MNPQEARQIAADALRDTSAKHLEVAFVVEKDGNWVVLLTRDDQDWVVKVPVHESASAEDFRSHVAHEVQRLF